MALSQLKSMLQSPRSPLLLRKAPLQSSSSPLQSPKLSPLQSPLMSPLLSPKSPLSLPRSPVSSPSLVRRFSSQKNFVLEFSAEDQYLGKVVIKMLDGLGQLGTEFESLVTGCHGYGYRGSRVYACCRNEWCLMGDILYNTDPEEQDEPPTIYRGGQGIVETRELPQQDTIGSVVLISSDLNMDTSVWKIGPQFKICLSECLLRSGRVIGQVTEGLEVAQKISQLFEKAPRITINSCGSC